MAPKSRTRYRGGCARWHGSRPPGVSLHAQTGSGAAGRYRAGCRLRVRRRAIDALRVSVGRQSKTAGLCVRPFIQSRNFRSRSSRDAIKDLGLLLWLLLFLLGGGEVGRAEAGLLLHRVLLLFLLGGGEIGRAEAGLLLHRVLLLFLLGGGEIGRAEAGLLLHRVLLLFLLGGGEVGHAEAGLLLHRVLLLFLLGGGQFVAFDDAIDRWGRERGQAHRGEEAERDG